MLIDSSHLSVKYWTGLYILLCVFEKGMKKWKISWNNNTSNRFNSLPDQSPFNHGNLELKEP